jgi:hypothetical protein
MATLRLSWWRRNSSQPSPNIAVIADIARHREKDDIPEVVGTS